MTSFQASAEYDAALKWYKDRGLNVPDLSLSAGSEDCLIASHKFYAVTLQADAEAVLVADFGDVDPRSSLVETLKKIAAALGPTTTLIAFKRDPHGGDQWLKSVVLTGGSLRRLLWLSCSSASKPPQWLEELPIKTKFFGPIDDLDVNTKLKRDLWDEMRAPSF